MFRARVRVYARKRLESFPAFFLSGERARARVHWFWRENIAHASVKYQEEGGGIYPSSVFALLFVCTPFTQFTYSFS